MSAHPIEALLRSPVELWSTLVAFATAGIAILAPWALMMPPGVAYGAGAVLGLIGLIRGRQAWRVLRYQRNMRRLPTPQPPQALFRAGLSLDPETHSAIARYHPARGPALRPAG